jgi:hypothetical protein
LVAVGGLQVFNLILQAWIMYRTRIDVHAQIDLNRLQIAEMSQQTTDAIWHQGVKIKHQPQSKVAG